MRPEIIKWVNDENERRTEVQIPLYLPVPEDEEQPEEEDVSRISHVIEIDL